MPTRVLMVCLGNICRSPLAEGLLNSLTGPEIIVDSAGTAGYHTDSTPDPRSIAVAKKHGIDISGQRCRKFDVRDFDEFDYIFAMDRENLNEILNQARSESDRKKVSLLLEASDSDVSEVPDPYYGGEEGFDVVFEMIQKACLELSGQLNRE